MGYRSLVRDGVRLAFDTIGDLASEVTLRRAGSTSFDFQSGAASTSGDTTKRARLVVVDRSKPFGERNTERMQVLLRTEDHLDITLYDSVLIDSVEWRFGPAVESDGYTTLAYVTREA